MSDLGPDDVDDHVADLVYATTKTLLALDQTLLCVVVMKLAGTIAKRAEADVQDDGGVPYTVRAKTGRVVRAISDALQAMLKEGNPHNFRKGEYEAIGRLMDRAEARRGRPH
jgi:hypothetical protein